MVSRFLKAKKSKRQTTRMREKIKKKVRDHNKKLKRKTKKHPNKRKVKDPGIPSSIPFKEEILKEAEKRKIERRELEEQIKEKRKLEREKLLAKKRKLDSVVTDALRKQKEFERRKRQNSSDKKGKAVETSLKTFYKEFKKVIDAADVVLEVLDARDPLGSRCREVEQAIIGSSTNKRLVLVLNKIDLVPKENVQEWLKHLRNEFPTVAFKASTQAQNQNLSRRKVKLSGVKDDLLKSSHCLGAEVLMKLLGNYCRNQDIKTSVRVGVVGFPNTGKSSIINSLKRSKACNVGATPGVTRSMQEVQLDKHIQLLDSPGVVMAQATSDTATVLRNVVKIEVLEDPIPPVEAILKRSSKQQLMLHYSLPDYNDPTEFLALLAKRRGKLKKGGIPDVEKVARSVLQDWTSGKITYYTHPPEQSSLPTHISAEFVSEMGKAFSLDDFAEDEAKILDSLNPMSSTHMLVDSVGPVKCIVSESDLPGEEQETDDTEMAEVEEDDDHEDMEGSEEEQELKDVSVSLPSSHQTSVTSSVETMTGRQTRTKKEQRQSDQEGILQLNKQRMKEFKKMKKKRKRDGKVIDKLSETLTSAFSFEENTVEEDYDFATDFR